MRTAASSLIILLTLIANAASTASADDVNTAPFGLEWGMSSTQARALGLELQELPTKDFGVSYSATKLPRIIIDVGAVALSFGQDDKLWRIAARSNDFSNDPYGTAVISRYDELCRVLAEKYGRGIQHHQLAEYTQPEHFILSVEMGRSWHYTDYTTDLLTIQIGIGASDGSTGFYRIIFENKPLRAGFEKQKRAREKGAL